MNFRIVNTRGAKGSNHSILRDRVHNLNKFNVSLITISLVIYEKLFDENAKELETP